MKTFYVVAVSYAGSLAFMVVDGNGNAYPIQRDRGRVSYHAGEHHAVRTYHELHALTVTGHIQMLHRMRQADHLPRLRHKGYNYRPVTSCRGLGGAFVQQMLVLAGGTFEAWTVASDK